MTEHDPSPSSVARPDAVAELRQVLDLVMQAEKLLVTATNRLDAVAAQPSGPSHPPPPPPWRETLLHVQRELDTTAGAVARAQRVVAALLQNTPTGKPGT